VTKFFSVVTSANLGCLINGGFILTIDLVMEFGLLNNKMEALHVNSHFLL
jgi:hypothetical protein